MINNALTDYYDDKGKYPSSLEVLVPSYFFAVPTDPSTGNEYNYEWKNRGKSFVMSTVLELSNIELVYTPRNVEEVPLTDVDSDPLPESEEVVFTREIINGKEIYSMPLFDDFGLNFSLKDKKLIVNLTKDGLINILESIDDSQYLKLKDDGSFAEQFNLKKIPKKITSISYSYPYSFVGLAEYSLNFYSDFLTLLEDGSSVISEDVLRNMFEFIDKGVAPFLKTIRSTGSYSYSPTEGLIISKQRIIIKELPVAEKRDVEEYWDNIFDWIPMISLPLFINYGI